MDLGDVAQPGDKAMDWVHACVFTGRQPEELSAVGVRPGTRVCVHRSNRSLVEFGQLPRLLLHARPRSPNSPVAGGATPRRTGRSPSRRRPPRVPHQRGDRRRRRAPTLTVACQAISRSPLTSDAPRPSTTQAVRVGRSSPTVTPTASTTSLPLTR